MQNCALAAPARRAVWTSTHAGATCRRRGNALHCAIPAPTCHQSSALGTIQAVRAIHRLPLPGVSFARYISSRWLAHLEITPDTLAKLEDNSPLGVVLAAALRNVDAPREVMKESIEEAGSGVAHTLERFLTTLGTIATLAPLMGLFGTVVGMIEIFGSQNASGSNPAQLAHGISVALYNTGFGLAIAMPALVFYRHFRALVDSFVIDMEQQAVKFVDIV